MQSVPADEHAYSFYQLNQRDSPSQGASIERQDRGAELVAVAPAPDATSAAPARGAESAAKSSVASASTSSDAKATAAAPAAAAAAAAFKAASSASGSPMSSSAEIEAHAMSTIIDAEPRIMSAAAAAAGAAASSASSSRPVTLTEAGPHQAPSDRPSRPHQKSESPQVATGGLEPASMLQRVAGSTRGHRETTLARVLDQHAGRSISDDTDHLTGSAPDQAGILARAVAIRDRHQLVRNWIWRSRAAISAGKYSINAPWLPPRDAMYADGNSQASTTGYIDAVPRQRWPDESMPDDTSLHLHARSPTSTPWHTDAVPRQPRDAASMPDDTSLHLHAKRPASKPWHTDAVPRQPPDVASMPDDPSWQLHVESPDQPSVLDDTSQEASGPNGAAAHARSASPEQPHEVHATLHAVLDADGTAARSSGPLGVKPAPWQQENAHMSSQEVSCKNGIATHGSPAPCQQDNVYISSQEAPCKTGIATHGGPVPMEEPGDMQASLHASQPYQQDNGHISSQAMPCKNGIATHGDPAEMEQEPGDMLASLHASVRPCQQDHGHISSQETPCKNGIAAHGSPVPMEKPGDLHASLHASHDSRAGVSMPAANAQPARQEGAASKHPEGIFCVLLIPCKQALRGSFPLNGTYFQTNEVFLVEATARIPLLVSQLFPASSQAC